MATTADWKPAMDSGNDRLRPGTNTDHIELLVKSLSAQPGRAR